jgi:murein L,D-transpeptidase YcbB/YkuD
MGKWMIKADCLGALALVLVSAIGAAADPSAQQTLAVVAPPESAAAAAPAAAETPAATPNQPADNHETTAPAAPPPAPAANAPPAATPAAAALPPADAAIADRLRALGSGQFDAAFAGKQDRVSVDTFYSARGYAPLWISDGKANARAQAAIDYLAHVDADGLVPADYPVPDFAAADPDTLAQAEIKLTASVISYAHHASIGRVHWSRISGDISYDQKAPDPAGVLAALAGAADVRQTLAGYEPSAPAYLALKEKLAELRAGKTIEGKAPIPDGPVLKIGMKDDRVPQLFGRLNVPGDSGTTYDKGLADAVRKFQQEHQIPATGTLTQATVDALNGRQPDQAADIIIANLERWRWMPHDLGKTYVIVNLPDFMLHVISDGREIWATKVVDGKPSTPTPIMSAEMRSITVNPTWNVPDSIASNEYLPLLRQDPTILSRMGLTVSQNPDGTLHISQPPGENNALGRLRFNFPNKFSVYQHDSNQKYMFSNPMRASSHGCMRVEDPLKYAEVMLSLARPGEGYTEDRIRRMYGNAENNIVFPATIPVHLTYQTAFVDDDGVLRFREDVYGRDKALLAILKSDDRKVADIAIERHDNAVRREVLAMPEQAFGSGWAGQNFFARLFTNPFIPQPAPVTRRAGAPQRRAEAR